MKNAIFTMFAGVVLAFSATGFAQSQGKEITKEEYYGPWRAALQKARTLSRRNVSKTEILKDGKVSATDEWTYEYVLPDRIRYIHKETEGDITRQTEQIDMGKTKYCRRGNGPWEKIQSPCIGGGAGGIPSTISASYSVENTKADKQDVKLFRQYITYKDTFSKNKENEGLSYYETKYWLSKDGLLIKEEIRYGFVDSKMVKRITVGTYEYDQNIKIEAPIK